MSHTPRPAKAIFYGQPAPQTTVRKNGGLVVHVQRIAAVGIADITQVKEHRISEVMGTLLHAVYFHNGGHLFYNYGIEGDLTELQGKGVDLHFAADGKLMVAPTCTLTAKEGCWQPFSGKSVP